MPRRRHVGALAALPVLFAVALTGCATFGDPDVFVRTKTLVCPSLPPESLLCPVVTDGDTLGATIETLRRRGECLDDRVKTWEASYTTCLESG